MAGGFFTFNWISSTQDNPEVKVCGKNKVSFISDFLEFLKYRQDREKIKLEIEKLRAEAKELDDLLSSVEKEDAPKKEQTMPDKTLTCVDCGKDFRFSEKEQVFYNQRGFQEPKRCKVCRRAKRKQQRHGDRGGDD